MATLLLLLSYTPPNRLYSQPVLRPAQDRLLIPVTCATIPNFISQKPLSYTQAHRLLSPPSHGNLRTAAGEGSLTI